MGRHEKFDSSGGIPGFFCIRSPGRRLQRPNLFGTTRRVRLGERFGVEAGATVGQRRLAWRDRHRVQRPGHFDVDVEVSRGL